MESNLELYLHIPFCARKCSYCDFLSFPAAAEQQEQYLSRLKDELISTAPKWHDHQVSSVFIGGGTPSVLRAEEIAALMDTVRTAYRLMPDAEVTIECNPASTLRHKFAAYKKAGINRLSIGLQSADNAELRMLGRLHSFEEFLKCYQGARMEGFQNINVDLINCLPMQTAASWRKTLRTVLLLKPEHLSVYNLIVEEGTPFGEMKKQGLLMLPSEEEQVRIDTLTRELLSKQGYARYEISNWERKGHACRHNTGYWTGIPYLGFGLGASSFDGVRRYRNTDVLSEYLAWEGSDPEVLHREIAVRTRTEAMEEFMFLGLRMTRGVRAADFIRAFGVPIESVYGEQLKRFCSEGLMERTNGKAELMEGTLQPEQRQTADADIVVVTGTEPANAVPELSYRLTERGMDISNIVLSEFLLD